MSKFFCELTWNKIEWDNSYEIVRRSQRRIFKASQLGDKRKVKQLQQRLIRSSHAKLLAVQQVTTLNKGKNSPVPTNPSMKLTLAKNLHLNGKASLVKRVGIPKPGKVEERPTIQDRAKQALAKLALEPEWEAKFEPNSYGFRPGRSSHDAIEAIFLNLRSKTDKLVYAADIRKSFDRIDHNALLAKIESFPLMERQISAWLKAGIMDEHSHRPRNNPMAGIISPLLANIAFHGLEEHLKNYVCSGKFPKPLKRAALGVIRYADDFIIIHRNPEIMKKVILETKDWLAKVGLEISPEKTRVRKASESFNFLGFQITLVMKQGQYRIKITPSKENVKKLTHKTRKIIQNNKSASSYGLIYLLRPVLIGWGNFFRYCECKETFKKVDNILYNQIRAWVFRRATRQGRETVKQKYFPENRVYKFQNRTYKGNWILNGTKTLKGGKPRSTNLPKLAWIASEKYVKEKRHLLVPNALPGKEVLHRKCHTNKTLIDLQSSQENLAEAG
jgi:RNA-directed DNA polymerase